MMQRVGKTAIWLGVILILVSLGIMIFLHISANNADRELQSTLTKLKELLPPESIGTSDGHSYSQMPVLELNGRDLIGLITIPKTATELPIAAEWDSESLSTFPQRFSGSAYNKSLVIGGADRKGQFDCLEKLDIGYDVFITDMTGACFSYEVERIDRKRSVDVNLLGNNEAELMLFVQDDTTQDYIVVYCAK